MPKHAKTQIVKRTITHWDITALFRRGSRAVEFHTFRNLSTDEMNRLLTDPAMIRVEIMGSKKEVIFETQRVPISASKIAVNGASN